MATQVTARDAARQAMPPQRRNDLDAERRSRRRARDPAWAAPRRMRSVNRTQASPTAMAFMAVM